MTSSFPDDSPELEMRAGGDLDVKPALSPLPESIVCPYLAGGDGTWRAAQPTRSHVCSAVQPPAVLTASKQRQLCLISDHETCATYSAARALLGSSGVGGVDAGLWPSGRPGLITLEPVRSGLAVGITSPQGRTGGQAVLTGLIVVAFLVLVIARTTSTSSVPDEPTPSTLMAAGQAGGSSPVVDPTPDVVAPGPSATASATSGAAALATPSPATGRTYKVKRGDTLNSIALKFGVTVKALRKANGLSGGEVIRRGQVLVIPDARPASPLP